MQKGNLIPSESNPDTDIVISPSHIKLCEIPCSFQLAHNMSGFDSVRATLHWEQDYPRNKEGYCFNPEGLFQPAEQRTEEQGKRVVFQLRGLTGIVSTWTHRERDNRQVERERGETQRVVDKE